MVHAIEDLQKDWPGWKIWRSSGGSWMATRRIPKPKAPAGFFTSLGFPAETLMEDGPRELTAALKNQAAIEAELKSFTTLDHGPGHPIGPACPLSCLALTRATEHALIVYWHGDGQYAPTVRDLLRLCQERSLTTIFGTNVERAGEIDRKLKTLGIEERV
jgi:hypothetical protein